MDLNDRLKAGDTFCVVPWINDYTDTNGKKYMCCLETSIELDGINDDKYRQMTYDGVKIPHCRKCYDMEDKGLVSSRQWMSKKWLKETFIQEIFENSAPKYTPIFFDIRADNKCNLGCVSCKPDYSSFIAKELQIKIETKRYLPDEDKLSKAKVVYFAGGEPTIIEEYHRIMMFLKEKNPYCQVIVNTNLSNLTDNFKEAAKGLEKLSFIVSVDGSGKVGEYHRYPLKWSKFMSNLDYLRDSGYECHFNTLIDAVSVFGLNDMGFIDDYITGPDSFWSLTVLTAPKALELKNVPEHLKDLASANIRSLQNTRMYQSSITFKNSVDGLEKILREAGDPKSLAEHVRMIDNRRSIKHSDYLGVELY